MYTLIVATSDATIGKLNLEEAKMTLGTALLKAKTVGVRSFRDKVSQFIHAHKMLVVTDHGNPTSVLMPYDDVLELVDVLEELQDKETLATVAEARKSIKRGSKGVLASDILKKK